MKIQDVDKDIAGNLGLKEPHGAIISEVLTDGPAAAAGLKVEDAIVQIELQEDRRQPRSRAHDRRPSRRSRRSTSRSGANKDEQTFKVKLGTYPEQGRGRATRTTTSRTSPRTPAATVDLKQLGITLKPATGTTKEGVVISEVDPNSDAATKGLQARVTSSSRPPART